MRKKWTFEKLQAEALKYATRSEFAKNSSGAYQAACVEGVLDKICLHMKDPITAAWEDEEI